MFFHWRPSRAVLSDTNAELIETYEAIRSDYRKVVSHLRGHAAKHSSEYYYYMRSASFRNEYTRAAKFIYLNRTCWNGLYRVNQQGIFNVPKGSKTNVLLDGDDFEAIATLLREAQLVCADFEPQIDAAQKGDVVFADPPYTVRHKHNGFVKYNETLFCWNDQVRLRDALLRAKQRGVNILLTNADHKSIRALYQPPFQFEEMSRFSAISGLSSSRGKYAELLVR